MAFICQVSDAVIGVLSPGIGRKVIPLKYHVNAAERVKTMVLGPFSEVWYQVVLERSLLRAERRSPAR
jgi:hypothetical protein